MNMVSTGSGNGLLSGWTFGQAIYHCLLHAKVQASVKFELDCKYFHLKTHLKMPFANKNWTVWAFIGYHMKNIASTAYNWQQYFYHYVVKYSYKRRLTAIWWVMLSLLRHFWICLYEKLQDPDRFERGTISVTTHNTSFLKTMGFNHFSIP